MSRMGLGFVEAFYRAYLDGTGGIALAALEPQTGQVVGVVAGGSADIRSRFLRRAWRAFFGAILRKSIVDCVVRSALLNWVRGKLGRRQSDQGETDDVAPGGRERARLQVICALEEWRGTGAAAALMASFRQACREAGCGEIELSVSTDNARAIAFYVRMGCKTVDRGPRITRMRLPVGD